MQQMEIQFKKTLHRLFQEIGQHPKKRYFEADLLRFAYMSPTKPGKTTSSTQYALEAVLGGLDSFYDTPKQFSRFINSNLNNFPQLIVPKAVYASLNCGPYLPVKFNDVQLCRSIDAHTYVAIDANVNFAEAASKVVCEDIIGIKSSTLPIDFMHPAFRLPHLDTKGQSPEGRPIIFTAYANTLAKVDVYEALKKISKATQHKAAMLLICDDFPATSDVTIKYKGPYMHLLMKNLWESASDVLTNQNSKTRHPTHNIFNPCAFEPIERYDASLSAVKHEVVVCEDTFANIGRRTVKIPQGTIIRTGLAYVREPEDLAIAIQKANWKIIPTTFTEEFPGQALFIAAKSTPRSWIPALNS